MLSKAYMRLGLLTHRQQSVLAGGLSILGIVHVLVPQVLLKLAAVGYRYVLAVKFTPTEQTPRRVRMVGASMITAAIGLVWAQEAAQQQD